MRMDIDIAFILRIRTAPQTSLLFFSLEDTSTPILAWFRRHRQMTTVKNKKQKREKYYLEQDNKGSFRGQAQDVGMPQVRLNLDLPLQLMLHLSAPRAAKP